MEPKETRQKHTEEEGHAEPGACPFCKEGRLTESPSGNNLVCQKCGRIVVSSRRAKGARKAGKQVPPENN
jgi:uncharacterized protein (DUF983 family)